MANYKLKTSQTQTVIPGRVHALVDTASLGNATATTDRLIQDLIRLGSQNAQHP